MKHFKTIIGLLFIFMFMFAAGCNNNCPKDNADQATAKPDIAIENAAWKIIEPEEIKDNPFNLLANDWMALATGTEDNMNAMTIAWGGFGVLWGKPVVTVYVSESRYTYDFMEKNEYFTVSAFPKTEDNRKALQYIGSHSGRDESDKIKKAGLTAQYTSLGNPMFAEARLTIECKLLYKKGIELEDVPESEKARYDKQKIHHMYIGEIVNAWEK